MTEFVFSGSSHVCSNYTCGKSYIRTFNGNLYLNGLLLVKGRGGDLNLLFHIDSSLLRRCMLKRRLGPF